MNFNDPRINKSRIKAELNGISTYYGKVCSKHPGLGGARSVYNYTCLECQREQYKRYNKGNRKIKVGGARFCVLT